MKGSGDNNERVAQASKRDREAQLKFSTAKRSTALRKVIMGYGAKAFNQSKFLPEVTSGEKIKKQMIAPAEKRGQEKVGQKQGKTKKGSPGRGLTHGNVILRKGLATKRCARGGYKDMVVSAR